MGHYHDQAGGLVMGSPQSLMIANLYMEAILLSTKLLKLPLLLDLFVYRRGTLGKYFGENGLSHTTHINLYLNG